MYTPLPSGASIHLKNAGGRDALSSWSPVAIAHRPCSNRCKHLKSNPEQSTDTLCIYSLFDWNSPTTIAHHNMSAVAWCKMESFEAEHYEARRIGLRRCGSCALDDPPQGEVLRRVAWVRAKAFNGMRTYLKHLDATL